MHIRLTVLIPALLFSLWMPLQTLAQSIMLPDIGDPARQYISLDEEHRLGSAVVGRLHEQGLIIEDVQLNEYLNSVGQRIAIYAQQPGYPFTFFLVRDAAINAFAAPGGFIGIHSGLMLATQGEDELVGVIAHEVAHVSQHHIARAFADSKRLSIPLTAALLASALLATSSGEAGQAALAGTLAAGAQHRINFTRANEQEADRIGSQIMQQAGYDPNGMVLFFTRLERLSGGPSSAQLPEFLRTHPLPSSRIADAQNRLYNRPRSKPNNDNSAYYLAKARLRVLSTPNTRNLIRQFETTLSNGDYKNEIAERYGYALALKRAGHYDQAQRQLSGLLKKDPDRLAFLLEQADIALAKRDNVRAWRLFEEARKLYTDDYTLAIAYGQALTRQGDARQALTLLEPHLHRRSNDASLYALYAEAAERAGDRVTTHAILAQYYYIIGDLKLAIEQARLGLRLPTSTPYQQARLRAQLRQYEKEQETEERR